MRKLTTFFMLLCLTISCSKETVKTPGQVSADQINAALSGTNITNAWIYEWNGSSYASPYSNASSVTFKLSGQFIILTVVYTSVGNSGSYKYYYNLERLAKFNTTTGGSPNYLDLYFN